MKYEIEYDLDDPRATLRHREIILNKPFLKRIYQEWYSVFRKAQPLLPQGKCLEIGSGGGFLKDVMPEVITSDILELPHVEMKIDAQQLPFENDSLSGIFMVNVFHHIPNPELFLNEAARTLKKGGKIIMIEPANSFMGRFIYRNFHHEPFEPNGGWTIESGKPMSVSNQALPYIYFERDKDLLEKKIPQLKINKVKYHSPLKYLFSGGVSRKPFVPLWMYPLFTFGESVLSPFGKLFGMFVTVEVEKR